MMLTTCVFVFLLRHLWRLVRWMGLSVYNGLYVLYRRRYRSFLKKNHPTELERYDEACEALRREEFARFARLQTLGLYLHLQVQQKEAQFRRRRNRLLLGMTVTGVVTSILLYGHFHPEQLQLIGHELATLPARRGCHPDKDEAWWDTARVEVGGDDFGETIDLTESMINRVLNEDKPLYITASAEAFKVEC